MKRKSSLTLLFGAILVLITTMALVIGYLTWNDLKEERVRDLEYTNAVISRYYELSFNQWRNTLLNLGERLYNTNGEDSTRRRLAIVNSAIKNYDELLAFGYASPDGKVLTFSGSSLLDSLPNLMLSENSKRSFLQAKKSDYISIGEAYYFPNVLDWILPMRVPIKNDSGKLLAVNTTALQYKTMNIDLNGFGFDPNYRIVLVNDAFNTIQFYYPLPIGDYPQILRKDASIFRETRELAIENINYKEALNDYEKNKSLVIKSTLANLDHSLYVSVDKSIIYDDAYVPFLTLTGAYALIMLFILTIYKYSKNKQKEYLGSLIESQANLTSIFESTNNIIGLFDVDKKLVEFNKAFSDVARATDNVILEKGMGIEALSNSPEMIKTFNSFQDRALAGEKFKETIEYPTADGNIIYFLLSYNPIYNRGRIHGLSMFVQDITELKNYQNNLEEIVNERTQELNNKNKELENTVGQLKNAQQQLIQAEKMASLGVLAAGIGHEINNPLNFIKNGATGLVQTLKNDPQINLDEIKPFLEIIDTGVTRANKIVKSLSHFSREVKSMDEECDINSTIEHCLTMLKSTLKDKIEVQLNLDSSSPKIKGNEGKLHQVFLNLISNAEQAIKNKGTISITTTYENDTVVAEISDDGVGISNEHLSKIADPFFTTKDPGIGTGLGLFISYNIIEEHNGSVSVSSELGKGSLFRIEFRRPK